MQHRQFGPWLLPFVLVLSEAVLVLVLDRLLNRRVNESEYEYDHEYE